MQGAVTQHPWGPGGLPVTPTVWGTHHQGPHSELMALLPAFQVGCSPGPETPLLDVVGRRPILPLGALIPPGPTWLRVQVPLGWPGENLARPGPRPAPATPNTLCRLRACCLSQEQK